VTLNDALRLASLITLAVVGILLIWSTSVSLKVGLGVIALALAAYVASGVAWRP
jgi:hypothetical protein